VRQVTLVNSGPVTLIFDTKEGLSSSTPSDPKQKEIAEAKARRKAEVEARTLANKERKAQEQTSTNGEEE
jgi:hypothetical protein